MSAPQEVVETTVSEASVTVEKNESECATKSPEESECATKSPEESDKTKVR